MEPLHRVLGPTAPDRQDPFWYEGPCADLDWAGHHYEVLACGEIRIRIRATGAEIKWERVARESFNDAGLASLVGNEDNTKGIYYWDLASWFEVVREDQGGNGSAFFNFKEAVEEMYRQAREDDKYTAPDR